MTKKECLVAWYMTRQGLTEAEAEAAAQKRWDEYYGPRLAEQLEERRRRREERRRLCNAETEELAEKGDLVDATQAETMARFLSRRFGVKMPRLSFTGRSPHRGFYTSWEQSITLAPLTRPRCVAHEFAHHLDTCINGWNKEHSESFYFNLKRVVEALGMDYPWQHDYNQVARWARKDGLL